MTRDGERQAAMLERRSVVKGMTAALAATFLRDSSMGTAPPDDGLVTIASSHSVKETIDRLDATLKAKGITVFARIDHAAGAAAVDLPLRPTELLIFGNPRAGTPLLQANQTVGVDLPLKVLAWQDASGKVWLTYNDPRWLARRHRLGADAEPAVAALATVLTNLAKAAAT